MKTIFLITIYLLWSSVIIFYDHYLSAFRVGPEVVSLLLTAALVVITAYYAFESSLIRKSSEKQNKLLFLPILKLQFCDPGKSKSEDNRVLLVINDGLGPAINVTLNDYIYVFKTIKYRLSFPQIASIKSGDHVKILAHEIDVTPTVSDAKFPRFTLDTRRNEQQFKLNAIFEDIFGSKRKAVFISNKKSKDGLSIELPQQILS